MLPEIWRRVSLLRPRLVAAAKAARAVDDALVEDEFDDAGDTMSRISDEEAVELVDPIFVVEDVV